MSQAPVARFLKSTSGLSVQFTDSSLYVPTSWSWAFGDGQVSTSKNPLHTYSTSGTYNVVLTAINGLGSDTVVHTIVVSEYPTLSQSISEMVECAVPSGIKVSGDCFDQNKAKWQLYLQPLVDLPLVVNPNDVFNEAKWPPLVNILISKLIIYEAILQAAAGSALAFNDTQAVEANTNATQVCDYLGTANTTINAFPSVVVHSVTVNNIVYPYTGANFANLTALVTWLNTLGVGQFLSSNPSDASTNFSIFSYANPNIPSSLSISSGLNGNYTIGFDQSNCQIVNLTAPAVLDGGAGNASQGPIRYIETGPSKVEWYDKSIFWKNVFSKDGVMSQLTSEICGFGQRLMVKLPMCKLVVSTPLFIVGRLSQCNLYQSLGGLWNINSYYAILREYLPTTVLEKPISVTFTTTLSVTINHGLGRYPFINVVDGNGNQILFSVVHTNPNQFTVNFLSTQSGTITYF